MNSNLRFSGVFCVLGWLMILEAGFLIFPTVVSVIYREPDWWTFLCVSVGAGVCGSILTWLFRGRFSHLSRMDAYLITPLVWISFSLFGMIPFMLADIPLDVSSAFFETMSGFTTTGATVISDVEVCSHGLLFWRSLIQWIGGLGIVLFILAVLPTLNQDGGIFMFNAEMTGISHDKLHPRIRQTAKTLWGVYGILTVLLTIILWVGPMDLFDSVCHSMTTLSTGGFSTRNASIAAFASSYVASAVTAFMLIGGMNFALIYNLCRGDFSSVRRNTALKTYILVVVISALVVSLSIALSGMDSTADNRVLKPLFLVTSAITTTGFTYGDFAGYGPVALSVVFMLMFSGACAGSTTGAVKIDRLVVWGRGVRNESMLSIYPNRMLPVEMNGRMVSEAQRSRLSAFLALYIALIAVGTLAAGVAGFSFTDSLFAVCSCIGNNGLGYGATSAGYGCMPAVLKWVLSFLMLAGRLELFTVFVIFIPAFWKR